MIVRVRGENNEVSWRNEAIHVEILLEDGQRFTVRERDGILSVWTNGDLIVRPRAANVVRLEEVR